MTSGKSCTQQPCNGLNGVLNSPGASSSVPSYRRPLWWTSSSPNAPEPLDLSVLLDAEPQRRRCLLAELLSFRLRAGAAIVAIAGSLLEGSELRDMRQILNESTLHRT